MRHVASSNKYCFTCRFAVRIECQIRTTFTPHQYPLQSSLQEIIKDGVFSFSDILSTPYFHNGYAKFDVYQRLILEKRLTQIIIYGILEILGEHWFHIFKIVILFWILYLRLIIFVLL